MCKTSFEKINQLKNVYLKKLHHSLFPMIIYSGAMKEINVNQTVETYNSVVDI